MPHRTHAKKPTPGTASQPPAFALQAKPRDSGLAIAPPAGGQPLEAPVRRRMEAALGHDFGSVRVHAADPSAPRIGALAYTRGEHLHFAPGAYRPQAADGRAILGHELTHVVQQRQGRVRATRPGALPLNDDPALEREADAHGARAAHASPRRETALPAASPRPAAPQSAAVQMIPWWKKALYGAAVVGGGAAAALATGGLALGGLALAASGGIGAYVDNRNEQQQAAREEAARQERERQERARLAREAELRRTGTERTQQNLAQLRDLHGSLGESNANPLLHSVLTEMLGDGVQQDTIVEGGSTTNNGETGRQEEHGHVVRLHDLETDDVRRQSYLLHELTHVSADRKYSMNQGDRGEFFNEPYVGPTDRDQGRHLLARQQAVTAQATAAQNVTRDDDTLGAQEREYIHGRLGYLGSVPNQEYDTVANELLLYSHQKGLPAHSPTVQQIHALAQDAYNRRNGAYAATG